MLPAACLLLKWPSICPSYVTASSQPLTFALPPLYLGSRYFMHILSPSPPNVSLVSYWADSHWRFQRYSPVGGCSPVSLFVLTYSCNYVRSQFTDSIAQILLQILLQILEYTMLLCSYICVDMDEFRQSPIYQANERCLGTTSVCTVLFRTSCANILYCLSLLDLYRYIDISSYPHIPVSPYPLTINSFMSIWPLLLLPVLLYPPSTYSSYENTP